MKIRIFAGVLFLLGASILLYPSVSAYLNSQNQAKVVEDYSNQVKQMNDAETEKELQKAREFNENLKRTVVIDPFTEEMNQQLSEEYLKILNKNNGQIGTLIKDSAEAPCLSWNRGKGSQKRRRTYSEYCISCGRRRNPCGSQCPQGTSGSQAVHRSG